MVCSTSDTHSRSPLKDGSARAACPRSFRSRVAAIAFSRFFYITPIPEVDESENRPLVVDRVSGAPRDAMTNDHTCYSGSTNTRTARANETIPWPIVPAVDLRDDLPNRLSAPVSWQLLLAPSAASSHKSRQGNYSASLAPISQHIPCLPTRGQLSLPLQPLTDAR